MSGVEMSVDRGEFRSRRRLDGFDLTLLAWCINHHGEWRVDLTQMLIVDSVDVEEMRRVFLSPEVMDGLCAWWAEHRPSGDPPAF